MEIIFLFWYLGKKKFHFRPQQDKAFFKSYFGVGVLSSAENLKTTTQDFTSFRFKYKAKVY